MAMTDTRTFEIGVSFSIPEEFHDPFEYREQIAGLMTEAGWEPPHSAGFGCGYGDIAWTIATDDLDLINSLAILIDRLGGEMVSLKVQHIEPMTAEEIARSAERDEKIEALRKAGDLRSWLERDTEERMDDAYRKTLGYKPTMDATMLHAWAQDMIETITGEFKMEDHL